MDSVENKVTCYRCSVEYLTSIDPLLLRPDGVPTLVYLCPKCCQFFLQVELLNFDSGKLSNWVALLKNHLEGYVARCAHVTKV